MTIKQWPETDRPRERLLSMGAEHLTDSELLAIIIQNGTNKMSSLECAHLILKELHNCRGVIEASRQQLCQYPGIGPIKYTFIQAAAELGRRYYQQNPVIKGAITSADNAQQYFTYTLRHKKQECIAILYLNAAHEIITYDEPFQGSLTQVHIHYRECIQKALNLNATALIIAHNHPTGLAQPSQMDIDTTKELIKVFKVMDIAVLDHIIIGQKDSFSMRQHGIMG